MLKAPSKPKSLEIFQALQGRMTLSQDERATFRRLSSGYQGERMFYEKICQHLPKNYPTYFDLSLKVSGSHIQIDALIPTETQIYHLEIKNYTSAYTLDGQHWLLENGNLIQNPLLQLERTKGLLNIFNQIAQINLPVTSYLVFLQPTFHLYQASKDLPIIYPNMIDYFLKKVSQEKAYNSPQLQQAFYRHHQTHSIFEKTPFYTIETLNKGFFCENCAGELIRYTKRLNHCEMCGGLSKVSENIIKAIDDFQTLFPDEKITTKTILNWINYHVHRSHLQAILAKHYRLIKNSRGSYYLAKN